MWNIMKNSCSGIKEDWCCKAFALTGRLADCYYTQGDALGQELLGLQPVLDHTKEIPVFFMSVGEEW